MCTQVMDHVKHAALGQFNLPDLPEWKDLTWPTGLSGRGVKGKGVTGPRSSRSVGPRDSWAQGRAWGGRGEGQWDWHSGDWQGWSGNTW